ncbi:MAG: hypothetical protein E7523_04040 [Ruminococcaceae bacterium]|nr:hypothetical protein [Oscillospiraceae bacterium]
MIGVILAAGDGTRLKNSTGAENCKALTKINNKYLIEFSLSNLISMGITKVIIVVGKSGDVIRKTIGHAYKGLSVSYVCQPQQKGLINAFMEALSRFDGEDVVLQLSDEIFVDFKTDAVKVLSDEIGFDFYCGVTYEDNPDKIRSNFSIDADENAVIKNCIEKPTIVKNKIKGTGFCIFRKNTLKILKEIYDETANTPNDLCDFINYLTAQHKCGKAFCVAEKEFNINTAADLAEAVQFFKTVVSD